MNDFEVKNAVLNRYRECLETAKEHNFDRLEELPVRFDLKGSVSGQFCVKNGQKYFRVNLILARENLEHYLIQTVPHEFCHYIVNTYYFRLYGSTPHGRIWKRLMVNVFGLNPARCHEYNVTNSCAKTVKRYAYKCDCTIHEVSSILHKRMLAGQKRRCLRCHSIIVYNP